jgi:hypothetical protein
LNAITELDFLATRIVQHFSIHRFYADWPARV